MRSASQTVSWASRLVDCRTSPILARQARPALPPARGSVPSTRTVLRDDDLPGPDQLAALTAAFQADTGLPARFSSSGTPRELASAVRLALYRVTQEALTNVRKHARPDRVEVRLDYLPEVVSLTVEDYGIPPEGGPGGYGGAGSPPVRGVTGGSSPGDGTSPPGEQGYGLTGMRERAELLGGTLDAAPTGAGFRVLLKVPA